MSLSPETTKIRSGRRDSLDQDGSFNGKFRCGTTSAKHFFILTHEFDECELTALMCWVPYSGTDLTGALDSYVNSGGRIFCIMLFQAVMGGLSENVRFL